MRCTRGDGPPMIRISDDLQTSMAKSDGPTLPEQTAAGMEAPLPLQLTHDSSLSKEKVMANTRSSRESPIDSNLQSHTPIDAQPIQFYEVEACLVNDSDAFDSDRHEMQQTVYDAVFLPDPWWKEHLRAILISFGISILLMATALIAIIFAGFVSYSSRSAPEYPTTPPPPLVEGVSGVISLGAFNGTDCDYCRPFVAIDEDTAVVAPWSNEVLNQIYITDKTEENSFETSQTIDVSVKEQRAIVVGGNVLVVGLPNETEERGAVYVYSKNSTGTWRKIQRIVPTDGQVDAEFGFKVDMDDDVMVIGAYNDRDIERKIGSAYVYRHNGNLWEFEAKLAPPDDGKIADFGRVVAIMRNFIAIGDQAYDPLSKPKHKGAVWIYEYNTSSKSWSLLQFMRNDDCDNWFGSSVSFTYDLGLLVGCAKDDDEAGAVFYYEPSSSAGYALRQKITTSDRDARDLIAQADSMAVYSNVMAVGTGKAKNGSVYIFLKKNDAWVEVEKIPSPPDQVNFGRGVAMSGGNLIVSADHNAFYYELIEGPSMLHCMPAKAGSALLDTDCVENCKPNIAIDRNIAAVADVKSIRVYSHDDNNFTMNASFEVDAPIKAVSVSDGTIIAGVTWKNEVRVFEMSPDDIWIETPSLPHNVSDPKESFGEAVDIDGDIAAVGANAYRTGDGSVYVFRRGIQTSWVEEGRLLPDDPYLKGFGTVLSVVNNTIAAGDPRYNNTMGVVFVYHYNETSRVWIQMNETISNSDCDGGFGSSLALTRDNGLFIGCPGYQSDMGAVYYYVRSEMGGVYHLIQKLQPVGGKANDEFGGPDQLAVDGGLLVVGTDKEMNGTAHVFAKLNTSWVDVETLHSPHGQRVFGYKVALSKRTLLASSVNYVFPFTLGSDCL